MLCNNVYRIEVCLEVVGILLLISVSRIVRDRRMVSIKDIFLLEFVGNKKVMFVRKFMMRIGKMI